MVLGIYFCLVLPRYKTLTFNGKLGVLVSADIKDLVWEFEDGSRFDLRKGCKAKVEIANEIEVNVTLENGVLVCEIEGNGEIVATDNGDPTNFVPFPSHQREAFNGLALVIVRSKAAKPGVITVTAKSAGLKEAQLFIKSR